MSANIVDEVLQDIAALEEKKQRAIAALLEQRAAYNKEIDAKLRQLGYGGDSGAGSGGKTKVQRKCRNCGQLGHTAKTCTAPTLASSAAAKPPKLVKGDKKGADKS